MRQGLGWRERTRERAWPHLWRTWLQGQTGWPGSPAHLLPNPHRRSRIALSARPHSSGRPGRPVGAGRGRFLRKQSWGHLPEPQKPLRLRSGYHWGSGSAAAAASFQLLQLHQQSSPLLSETMAGEASCWMTQAFSLHPSRRRKRAPWCQRPVRPSPSCSPAQAAPPRCQPSTCSKNPRQQWTSPAPSISHWANRLLLRYHSSSPASNVWQSQSQSLSYCLVAPGDGQTLSGSPHP